MIIHKNLIFHGQLVKKEPEQNLRKPMKSFYIKVSKAIEVKPQRE